MRIRAALNIVEAKLERERRDRGAYSSSISFSGKEEIEALDLVFRLADGTYEEIAEDTSTPPADGNARTLS